MLIGNHHEKEQFNDGLVLAVCCRVNGDMAVEVAQLLVHLRSNLARERRDVATQEIELMQQHVLGNDLLRRHVRDSDERQYLVRLARSEQRG
jgi:hypothetical protein